MLIYFYISKKWIRPKSRLVKKMSKNSTNKKMCSNTTIFRSERTKIYYSFYRGIAFGAAEGNYIIWMFEGRLELPTSWFSITRSNQLSYSNFSNVSNLLLGLYLWKGENFINLWNLNDWKGEKGIRTLDTGVCRFSKPMRSTTLPFLLVTSFNHLYSIEV